VYVLVLYVPETHSETIFSGLVMGLFPLQL
jgi:hypothetical protein